MRCCSRFLLTAFFASLLCPAWSSAQVVLRTDFNQPSEYQTTEKVEIGQTLNIAGQSIETSSEQEFGMSYRVGEADAAGLIPLQMKFETVKASIGLPGGVNVEFDSKNDDGQESPQPAELLKSALRALVGIELTAMVDRKAQVQSFTGAAMALEKIAPEMKSVLASQLDEAMLKSNLQMAIDRFPAEPVKPGDVWTRTQVMNLGQGQQMTFDERLEYVGTVEKEGHKLEHVRTQCTAVRFGIADNAALPLKVKESDLKIESSSGDLYVDLQTHRIFLRNEKVNVKGKIVFVADNADLPATIDLTIDTTHTEGAPAEATPAP